MDAITELIHVILYTFALGGFVLLGTRALKVQKSSGVKSDITNLQAKISQLRLALRGKVRRKSNIFRASFKAGITEGDMIDNALKDLSENPFDTGESFQTYFDASRKIVNYIQMQQEGDAAGRHTENNFMCSDFKTEMDIVRIIKEMNHLSSRINARIEDHNRINPNTRMPKVDPLVFPSLAEIGRIFNDENAPDETPAAEKTVGDSRKAA